jgi:hypothetical protein
MMSLEFDNGKPTLRNGRDKHPLIFLCLGIGACDGKIPLAFLDKLCDFLYDESAHGLAQLAWKDHMIPSRTKTLVVALLLFTGLFQGWPLVVATQCSMLAATAQACGMKSACCCDEPESGASRAYAKCTTGKKLTGVLSTDPSLLSAKDKNEKSLLSCAYGTVSFSNLLADIASPGHYSVHPYPPTGHQFLPSDFLLDCVLRI